LRGVMTRSHCSCSRSCDWFTGFSIFYTESLVIILGGVIRIVDVSGRAFEGNYFTWYPHNHGVFGNVVGDDAVGADGGIIAYGNRAKDFCAGADVDINPNDRHASARTPAADADGDLMRKVAVPANLGVHELH